MNQPGWDYSDEEETARKACLSENLSRTLSLQEASSDCSEHETVVHRGAADLIFIDDEGEQDDEKASRRSEEPLEVDEGRSENGESEERGGVSSPASSDYGAEEEDHSAGGRYFGGGDGGPKCFNCGVSGHISKECPEAVALPCFLCGTSGHQRSQCPEEICYNCGRVGHMSRNCQQPRKRRMYENDLCNRCGMPGHIQKDCSLSWRRYAFAREPTRSEIARASSLLAPSCYFCAASTHFGDECPSRRKPEWSIFHRPLLEFLQLTALTPSSESSPRSSARYTRLSKFDALEHRDRRPRREEDGFGTMRVSHVYRRGERREGNERERERERATGDNNWRNRDPHCHDEKRGEERSRSRSRSHRDHYDRREEDSGRAARSGHSQWNDNPRSGSRNEDYAGRGDSHYDRHRSHYTGSYRRNNK